MTRRPVQNRWSDTKLAQVKMTPRSTRANVEQAVRSETPTEAVDGRVAVAQPTALRNFRINARDLTEHGYTERCPQCRHIEAVGRPRPGGTHSAACRKRILEAIGQSDAGKQRLDDHEARLGRAMLEYSSLDGAPAVAGGAADGEPREALRGSVFLGPRDHSREYAEAALNSWKPREPPQSGRCASSRPAYLSGGETAGCGKASGS